MKMSRLSPFVLLAVAACGAAAASNEAGTPTGTVHGNVETAYRLAIVHVCQPAGSHCRLGFVDTLKNDDVAALVGRRLGQGRPGEGPSVQVLAVCAGSWLASVSRQEAPGAGVGVAGGGGEAASGPGDPAASGAPAGSSAVCGYNSARAALSAALDACDSQTGGACRRSGRLRASWGQWDGRALPGRDSDPGAVYDTWPGGTACDAALPLQASPSCGEQAVRALREAGVQ